MSQKQNRYYTVFTAKGTTGTGGKKYFAGDFRHMKLTVGTASSANCTIKVYGSTYEAGESVDFTASASATNMYSALELVENLDGTYIDGNTGIQYIGVDAVRTFDVNLDNINWLAFNITAIAAGTVTLQVQLTNND